MFVKTQVTVSCGESSIADTGLPSLHEADVSVQPAGTLSPNEYVPLEIRAKEACWPSLSEKEYESPFVLLPENANAVESPSGSVCFTMMIAPEVAWTPGAPTARSPITEAAATRTARRRLIPSFLIKKPLPSPLNASPPRQDARATRETHSRRTVSP